MGLTEGCGIAPSRVPGEWLEESVAPFTAGGVRLFNLIPRGFERYARILHPALDAEGSVVRWSDVAALTGRSMHPDVQWEALRTGPRGSAPDSVVSPWRSRTEGTVLRALKEILAKPDPGTCWMAAWAGRAGLEESFAAPRISTGQRDYLLFFASLSRVNDGMFPTIPEPLPGMWWPEDRSWCVAKDVDLCWTYVGGSTETIERILESPDLEAVEVGPEHRADYLSDQVNGPVRPTRHPSQQPRRDPV